MDLVPRLESKPFADLPLGSFALAAAGGPVRLVIKAAQREESPIGLLLLPDEKDEGQPRVQVYQPEEMPDTLQHVAGACIELTPPGGWLSPSPEPIQDIAERGEPTLVSDGIFLPIRPHGAMVTKVSYCELSTGRIVNNEPAPIGYAIPSWRIVAPGIADQPTEIFSVGQ